MSNLYLSAESDSGKTTITRRGHKEIQAHVRGWDLGVRVEAYFDKEKNKVSFKVFKTSGSNKKAADEFITVIED